MSSLDDMNDRLLQRLDVGLPGAILRAALGFAFATGFRAFLPGAGLALAVGALAVTLFGVKVAAVVGRRLARPSPRVATCWEWRRQLARAHDSYQVRKLLWVGVGIIAARLVTGPGAEWETWVAGTCVGVGALAEAWWRRKGIAVSPVEAT